MYKSKAQTQEHMGHYGSGRYCFMSIHLCDPGTEMPLDGAPCDCTGREMDKYTLVERETWRKAKDENTTSRRVNHSPTPHGIHLFLAVCPQANCFTILGLFASLQHRENCSRKCWRIKGIIHAKCFLDATNPRA